MTEYSYKNFKIHYDVQYDKTQNNLYAADGYISNHKNDPFPARKFHTEYSTIDGVKHEIKKLMESFIDLEWKEYQEINGRKAH